MFGEMASEEISMTLGDSCERELCAIKSFVEALRDKYCDDDEDAENSNNIVIVFSGPSKRKLSGSEDGGDAELGHLRTVVLNNCSIGHAGLPSGGLACLCPNIQDLDLQANRLTDWHETLTILSSLPRLKFLNLSSNKLHNSDNCLEKWTKRAERLADLVLNSTQISWEEVTSLVTLLPALKELHLCDNGYETIREANVEVLNGIETLRLNNNRIKRWTEVWKLRNLKNLQTLILSGNPVEDIFYSQSEYSHMAGAEDVCSNTPSCSVKNASEYSQNTGETSSQNTNNSGKTISPVGDTSKSDSEVVSSQILTDILENVCMDKPRNGYVMSGGPAVSEDKEPDTNMQNAVKITVLNSGRMLTERFSHNNLNADNKEKTSDGCHFVPNNCECPLDQSDPSLNEHLIPSQSDVAAGNPGETTKPFHYLNTLCLSQTCLSDWKHLHIIKSFPNVKSVRITNISLASDLPKEDKHKLFLACLPSVSVLNGGEISQTEREKAERHFIRHFGQHDNKPSRFHELQSKHGTLSPVVDIDLTRGFQEWVTVKFVFNGREVLEDKIHLTDSVSKLKIFIKQSLGKTLGLNCFKIWHMACGPFHEDRSVELQELYLSSLPLSRFDIQEADEIHIEKIDLSKSRPQNIRQRIGLSMETSQR